MDPLSLHGLEKARAFLDEVRKEQERQRASKEAGRALTEKEAKLWVASEMKKKDPRLQFDENGDPIPAVPADRPEAVNHPSHYRFGKDNEFEPIKVIHAWGLGFNLGNTIKYIARAGRKDREKHLEDLKKAAWYLADEIARIEAAQVTPISFTGQACVAGGIEHDY